MGRRSFEFALKNKFHDLYETPEKTTQSIIDKVVNDLPDKNNLIFYDCCCGNDAIVNVFLKNGLNCIGTDKFTKEKSVDALVDELPPYDMIVTNPPFNLGSKFLKMFYESEKPFLVILPIKNLGRIEKHQLFLQYGVIMYCIFPKPNFLYNGKPIQADETAWFYGNSGLVGEGEIIVKYCGRLYK